MTRAEDAVMIAALDAAAAVCRARAEYFRTTKGHFDRADAARSYEATAKEIEQIHRRTVAALLKR